MLLLLLLAANDGTDIKVDCDAVEDGDDKGGGGVESGLEKALGPAIGGGWCSS